MDDFNTLSNRLLNRCPDVGLSLSQQLVNDAWRTLQAKQEWSWRRSSGIFSPPTLYNIGYVSTNSGIGQPTLLTGVGTAWTPGMIGQQIRIGGLMFPFYDITGYLSPTQLLMGQPWAGPDAVNQAYSLQQCYYPVPQDFGYFYAIVSLKDGYRLWTNVTESDLAMLDPQRTSFGQTYAAAFRDFTPIYSGVISPCIPLGTYAGSPVSTTTLGYNYPVAATYLIQITGSGNTGAATYSWTRIGTGGLSAPVTTQAFAQDLSDNVQVYFPSGVYWTSGDMWVINAQPTLTSGVPRYELWPCPTYSTYLYPYQYIKKEYDLTVSQPQLPPFVANRGELLLEMALQKCAMFPGQDADHRNVYYDLKLALFHERIVNDMMVDFSRNDQEVGESNIDYQTYPMYPAPWMDGQWQQSHAPFLA